MLTVRPTRVSLGMYGFFNESLENWRISLMTDKLAIIKRPDLICSADVKSWSMTPLQSYTNGITTSKLIIYIYK